MQMCSAAYCCTGFSSALFLHCITVIKCHCVVCHSLQENPTGFETVDHCETIQEETSASQATSPAAAEAPAGASNTTGDLTAAAADAAHTAAAAASGSRSSAVSRRSSVNSLDTSCTASVFAAALPPSLRTGSEDNMALTAGLQALQGLHVVPSKRHSMLMSSRSMHITGLPRASTLKMMESSRAWEELHGALGDFQHEDS
jgi:hypothetical protein